MACKVFTILVALVLVVQLVLADPRLCPNPESAKTLFFKQDIHEAPTLFGRTEKVVNIPRLEKPLSCVLLTRFSDQDGSASITALGVSEDGVTVKLVSDIKKGIHVSVELYTE